MFLNVLKANQEIFVTIVCPQLFKLFEIINFLGTTKHKIFRGHNSGTNLQFRAHDHSLGTELLNFVLKLRPHILGTMSIGHSLSTLFVLTVCLNCAHGYSLSTKLSLVR